MLVLGIETSTSKASVAIGSEQGVAASALVTRGATHIEFLLPAIRFCLEQSGLEFRNLGGVAVGLGPGLYSGMRVGVATAKALAQALAVPTVGMASLDLVAYQVRYSRKVVCACLDARRGEVFYAFYRSSPGGVQRMTDYRVERPQQLATAIVSQGEDMLILGTGGLSYRDVFEDLRPGVEIGSTSLAFPDAEALVELALPRMFREDFDPLFELKPLYLRRSARPIQWERIHGSRSA